jgi:hypothetical protein
VLGNCLAVPAFLAPLELMLCVETKIYFLSFLLINAYPALAPIKAIPIPRDVNSGTTAQGLPGLVGQMLLYVEHEPKPPHVWLQVPPPVSGLPSP